MVINQPLRKFTPLSRLLLASVFALAAATSGQATIMQYLEVEDLTRLSSDIFHGRVVETSTYWSADRTQIYTAIKLEVRETFKGRVTAGQTVTVTQLGGEKDGVLLDFAGRPQFSVGESAVLFTARGRQSDFLIIGLKQGKLRVEGSDAVRDLSGIHLMERAGGGRTLQTVQPKRTRFGLDELRRRISNTK